MQPPLTGKAHHVDVLIVGAGVAGLTAAHRLLSQAPHLSIIVLEAADYVGGRVKAVPWGPPDGLSLNLGAHWIAGDGPEHPLHHLLQAAPAEQRSRCKHTNFDPESMCMIGSNNALLQYDWAPILEALERVDERARGDERMDERPTGDERERGKQTAETGADRGDERERGSELSLAAALSAVGWQPASEGDHMALWLFSDYEWGTPAHATPLNHTMPAPYQVAFNSEEQCLMATDGGTPDLLKPLLQQVQPHLRLGEKVTCIAQQQPELSSCQGHSLVTVTTTATADTAPAATSYGEGIASGGATAPAAATTNGAATASGDTAQPAATTNGAGTANGDATAPAPATTNRAGPTSGGATASAAATTNGAGTTSGDAAQQAATNTYTACAVILTASLGVLASQSIRFEPPLPADKLSALVNHQCMAEYEVVIAEFTTRFWAACMQPNSTCMLYAGSPRMLLHDLSCYYSGRPILEFHLAGDDAVRVSRQPLEQTRQELVYILSQAFGGTGETGTGAAQGQHRGGTGAAHGQHKGNTGETGTGAAQGQHRVGTGAAQGRHRGSTGETKAACVFEPIRLVCTAWGANPLTRGAFSIRPLGLTEDEQASIMQPFGGVHFAGDGFHAVHSGYMHAAYLSGIDAADAVATNMQSRVG